MLLPSIQADNAVIGSRLRGRRAANPAQNRDFTLNFSTRTKSACRLGENRVMIFLAGAFWKWKAERMPALSRRTGPSQDGDEIASHLARALTVKGVLDTDGELFVLGNVLGRINADRLVLVSGGYVEGDVVARDVLIGGRLNGRVFALNVTVDSSADITGRIFHHTVTVAKGARIEGRMPWRPPSYFETLDQLPETRA
jgi:cytoskeletal protein CcmA (bactofilin family)